VEEGGVQPVVHAMESHPGNALVIDACTKLLENLDEEK
jgi:hypothetical protein